MSAASRMAWMDKTGLAEWSVGHAENVDAYFAAGEAAEPSRPPTPAVKDVLRLRKKLREVAKIEERLAAGLPTDPLQRPKLERKDTLVAQLAQAERRATEELHEQEATAQGWQREGAAEADAVQLPPVQMYLPMQCGALEQQLQQQASWPGYGQPAEEVRFGSVDWRPSAARAEEEAFGAEEEEEEEGSQAAPASTSSRRRQRRQRAAQRPVEAAEAAQAQEEGEPDCEEVTAGLQAGGKARDAALERIRGWVAQLAFAKEGCRVVQLAVQVADHAAAGELLGELRGHVQEAMASPHANYVLQALISGLPTAMSTFVVQELRGSGASAARHRFGCRVLCRLVEHVQGAEVQALLGEVLEEAEDLCRHSFAHYVLQSMLEHMPEHRARIAQALRTDLAGHARHRCASHAVEAALEHCAEQDRRAFVEDLLGPGLGSLVPLAQSQYGSFVLKAVLRLPGAHAEDAWRRLREASKEVEASKYGQRLLKDLALRGTPV